MFGLDFLSGLTGGFSASSATSTSAPFVNDASLIIGSGTAGGVSGVSSDASAAAQSQPAATGSLYGNTPGSLTGTLSGLLNNTTFWLALGAVVTIALILRKKKG